MTNSIEEVLRSGDLISRAEVLRVLRRLGEQDADLALYGAEDNARAREYGEAAMTRACCAVDIMPAYPDHTPALLALIEERDRLKVERDEWRKDHADLYALYMARTRKRDEYAQKLFSLDGSCVRCASVPRNASGLCATCLDEDAERAGEVPAEARALAAEAERDALREALVPFGSGAVVFYENEPDDCVLSLGRWKYQEDGRARFYADVQFTVADVRRARALTQETNDVGE